MIRDERGSSPVEFVLVGALLTFVTLAVIQLGVAVYVRNVAHDAAVEGAYHAALADTSDSEGAARAEQIVTRTVGADAVQAVRVGPADGYGYAAVAVTMRITVPLLGLAGIPGGWEVTGHAPIESFE